MAFAIDDNVTKTQVDWSTSPSTGVWQHIIISRDGTNIVLYQNGTSRASTSDGTGNIDHTGTLLIGAGRTSGDTIDSFSDIRVADFAYLDRAITADEIAAFSDGYSPEFFNPSQYIDFIVDGEPDGGGSTLTATGGTPVVVGHPDVDYPFISTIGPPAAVIGATGKSNPLYGPLGGPFYGAIG